MTRSPMKRMRARYGLLILIGFLPSYSQIHRRAPSPTYPENLCRYDFKRGIDVIEGRRRHNKTSISIRNNKRDEDIVNCRAILVAPPSAMPVANGQ